ncbi:MAG: hypothetical protein ACK4VM_11835 [Bosea sp. (in: a-proteobacteria)]
MFDVTSLQPELYMTIGKTKLAGAVLKERFAQTLTGTGASGRPGASPATHRRSRVVDCGDPAGRLVRRRLDAGFEETEARL